MASVDKLLSGVSTTLPTKDQLQTWLNTVGIELTDEAIEEIYTKKFNRKSITEQFTHKAGLFRLINDNLKSTVGADLSKNTLMTDSAIKKLAELQSKYWNTLTSNTFRAGSKTVYTYGNNKFLVNEIRRMKQHNKSTYNGKEVLTNTLLTQIGLSEFEKNSYILKGTKSIQGA